MYTGYKKTGTKDAFQSTLSYMSTKIYCLFEFFVYKMSGVHQVDETNQKINMLNHETNYQPILYNLYPAAWYLRYTAAKIILEPWMYVLSGHVVCPGWTPFL